MVPAVPGMNGGTYGPERPFPTESFCCGACVCGDSRMSALISVVIPVYNAAGYLDACLQSLQAQTYPDWEAIVVDDGSTDASPDLCRAWAARDSRIRVLRQENAGVSAARNAGIAAAAGSFLAFVDADDRLEPDYLLELYSILGNSDLAVCSVYDNETDYAKIRRETVSLSTLRCTPSLYTQLVYINYVYNKLYRSELIRQHQLCFPVNMRRGEDATFVRDYLMHCHTISVTPRRLYYYDTHPGSAMHRFYDGICCDEIPLMHIQYDLFHPAGSASLTLKEEAAFQFWQHGKVLSILRYIAHYAPSRNVQLEQTRRFLADPLVRFSFTQTKAGIGIRGRLAAFFLNHEMWSPLLTLLKHI